MNVTRTKMRNLCSELGFTPPRKDVHYKFSKKQDIYNMCWYPDGYSPVSVHLIRVFNKYYIDIFQCTEKERINADLDMLVRLDIITAQEKQAAKKLDEAIDSWFQCI